MLMAWDITLLLIQGYVMVTMETHPMGAYRTPIAMFWPRYPSSADKRGDEVMCQCVCFSANVNQHLNTTQWQLHSLKNAWNDFMEAEKSCVSCTSVRWMRRAGRKRETTESRSGNSQGDPVTTHTHTHAVCKTHTCTHTQRSFKQCSPRRDMEILSAEVLRG